MIVRSLLLALCVCTLIYARPMDPRKRRKIRENKVKSQAALEIKERVDLFVKSWNNNDMETVAAISSKDAVMMGQGLDTDHGRDAIYFAIRVAKSVFDKINIKILEIVPVNKKYAFHIEEWKGYDQDGNIVVEKARSLIVWRKIKGEWYITRHMFNYVGNSY